ncbi:MAG: hypothetical protein AAF687_06100 [Pseudomonadota bacterium]
MALHLYTNVSTVRCNRETVIWVLHEPDDLVDVEVSMASDNEAIETAVSVGSILTAVGDSVVIHVYIL